MGFILITEALSKRFGGLRAPSDSLAVEAGSIFGIIGPNGTSKTTLFNCIAGAVKLSSGCIILYACQTQQRFRGEAVAPTAVSMDFTPIVWRVLGLPAPSRISGFSVN